MLLERKRRQRNRELTKKQQDFITHYFETKNATLAAKKAGYSEKNAGCIASLMLTKPAIKKAIELHKNEIDSLIIVTFNDKISLLWEIAQRCARPITEQVGDNMRIVDRSDIAVKAIEAMNKMQGHVAPDQHVSINVQSTIEKLKQCVIEYKDH